jgi:hypothetical protein
MPFPSWQTMVRRKRSDTPISNLATMQGYTCGARHKRARLPQSDDAKAPVPL